MFVTDISPSVIFRSSASTHDTIPNITNIKVMYVNVIMRSSCETESGRGEQMLCSDASDSNYVHSTVIEAFNHLQKATRPVFKAVLENLFGRRASY